jgi:hypothetical protein
MGSFFPGWICGGSVTVHTVGKLRSIVLGDDVEAEDDTWVVLKNPAGRRLA